MIVQDTTECSPFTPTDDISQGTIIKFLNASEEDRYGIIVTGDCDIDKEKFGEFLSYCSIFTLKYYIENFYIPKKCKSEIKGKLSSLKKEIIKCLQVSELSDDAFMHIFSYTDDELNKNIKNKNLIKQVKDIQPVLNKEDFTISDLKILSIKNFNEVSKFPGDKFYFTNLPDPEITSKGFVINLRRIKEIDIKKIDKTYQNNQSTCFAIAKLDPPYKQNMTRALGSMFSDIGLPTEYENQRDEVISSLSKELLK